MTVEPWMTKKTFYTKPNAWTAEIEEAVRVKWMSLSFTAAEIAKELGPLFTKNAVIGKMTRLGHKGGKTRTLSTRPHNEGRRLRRLAARGGVPHVYAGRLVEPPYQAPLAYSLEDLPAKGCHYPAGLGPYTFCGVPIERESYCGYHFSLTHYGHRSNTQQQRPASPQGVETPPVPSPPDAPGESLPTGIPEHHSKAIGDAKMVLWFYAHNKASK